MSLRGRLAGLGRRGSAALATLTVVLLLVAAVETSAARPALPPPALWALAALSAAALFVAWRSRARAHRAVVLPLAAAALVAFAAPGLVGLESGGGPRPAPTGRTGRENWPGATAESAERAADRVDAWLSDVTRRIGDAAWLLARTPNLAAAVEGSDARDFRSLAFDVLATAPLPASGLGPGGATLHDDRLRPVAWSPGASDLGDALVEFFPGGANAADCPDPAFPLFLHAELGGRGVLAAADCTRTLRGLVTVEIPLRAAPPPSSGAPAASALEAAAGRGLEVQMLEGAEDPRSLADLFERRGERFLDGPPDARRYFFALRAYDGQLLGSASTVVAPAPARAAEQRLVAALLAAAALLLGSLVAGFGLWRRSLAASLAAVWLVRVAAGVFVGALPAEGRGDDLLTPLLPAGGPFLAPTADFWCGSPLDALLTALALFFSARFLLPALRPRRRVRPAWPSAFVRGLAAGGIATLTFHAVRLAGASGGAALAPTWRVGTGWAELTWWVALAVFLAASALLLAAILRPAWPSAVVALAAVGASAVLPGAAPGLALVTAPVLVAAAASWSRRGRLALGRLRRPLLSHEPGLAFLGAFGLLAGPAVLWYPALDRMQAEARRNYAETAAPVQILRHRQTVCHALDQAQRALDQEENRRGSFAGASAYDLWQRTGLAHVTAASGLEVRTPDGAASRFGVGLSRRPDPPPSETAASAWSDVVGCGGEALGAGRPAPRFGDQILLTTRRLFRSGETVTLRVADRDREIPFLPREDGIADHFLLRGGAAPPVFDGRDLRLLRPGAGLPADGPLRRLVAVEVGEDRFEVSWAATEAADSMTAALGWVLLGALVALLVAAAARIRRFRPGRAGSGRRSFQMQLTETLAAAVLVASFGLAVVAEGRLSGLLEDSADQEAMARSLAVERVASELGAFDIAADPAELELRLAHAADQTETDAALYTGGVFLAASRPELVETGLLPSRPPPQAHAEALRGGSPTRFSVEQLGPLRYRILWTALPVRSPLGEPAFLAVPLASAEPRRAEGVRALQRGLILGGGSVALVVAILLPGLLASRLAAPVRALARATERIADGSAEPLPLPGTVVELRLLAASVERLARRIPGVRRRMREEAAADLARRVAHDVKNALAPIALAADYIRRVLHDPRGVDPKQATEESVEDILAQVERLRRISSEFSALGAPLRPETVDLARLARETVGPWVRAPTGPEVRLLAERPVLLRADPGIVARIVENLVLNAVEAVGSGASRGRIEIRASDHAESGFVRIEVEDDGPGIPEELRDRIFDAEFSTRTRGSGLGLANARRFAEAHGGRIRALPRRGSGSGALMRVELPRAGPGAGAEQDARVAEGSG